MGPVTTSKPVTDIAARAARAVAEAIHRAGVRRLNLSSNDTAADNISVILSGDSLDDGPGKFATNEVVEFLSPIIAAEYEPVMEVLRDALREGFTYGRGVVECVECKSRARKERLIIHKGVCWVTRAQALVGET